MFQPGQSGNPSGRAKVPEGVKAGRALTKEQVKEVFDILLFGKEGDLQMIRLSQESSVLQKWIASAALKGIQRGDLGPLELILNRSIGKVKDELDHHFPKPLIIECIDGRKIILGSENDMKEVANES